MGEDALAAVGASSPVIIIFIAVATDSYIGGSVIISRLFGAREYVRMKTAIFTSLISMFFLSPFTPFYAFHRYLGFLAGGPDCCCGFSRYLL